MLKEPEQERDVVGPILEMSGTKMHISKVMIIIYLSSAPARHLLQGFENTTTFSKLLARAAGVSRGHVVLDMFLGLGYCALECLTLGAKRVICFEVFTLFSLCSLTPNRSIPRLWSC